MAYAKLPLPCPDYPFGLDDFNQMAANNAALYAALLADHGGLTSIPYSRIWEELGRHNSTKNCRSVIRAYPTVTLGAREVAYNLSGPAVASLDSPSVGEVRIRITGLGRWRALVNAYVSSSTPVRWVSAGWDQGTTTAGLQTLGLLLYENGALADFPFFATIWET